MTDVLPPLIIATRNAHKTQEIREMLDGRYAVTDLTGRNDLPEVEETGSTFLENAILKAAAISREVEGLVLSDDSGLEVDALGGDPGVRSSRYAGMEGDSSANNAKLIAALQELPGETAPAARFRCVMVLARGGEVLAHFEGSVEGAVKADASGSGGFGYDPLFVPEGHRLSFAELGPEVKNAMSHRGRALSKVVEWLQSQNR